MKGKWVVSIAFIALIVALGKAAVFMGADQDMIADLAFLAVGVLTGWRWFSPEKTEGADHG